MPGKNSQPNSRRIEWTLPALLTYRATLQHIAEQDAETLALFEQRVGRALSALADQPGIGTPRSRSDNRAFPVPKTGHTVEYCVRGDVLLILRWYRQRRQRD
jgi:plasmid stabilization system protein ParE